MKLKGSMTIELTDSNTGAVETVTEENMITDAVNNIFSMNPLGVFYKVDEGYNDIEWAKNLLPICPHLIGGILLFTKPLTEDAGNIYPPAENLPVAYAGNDVNSTANVARGSINKAESKALANGYKFVWEFTPSQGNGTIAAAALTSCWGGQNSFGSSAGTASTFLSLKKLNQGNLPDERQMQFAAAVEFDFEKEMLVTMTFKGAAVVITKLRVPTFTIGLNEQLDDTTVSIIEQKSIPVSTFKFADDYGNNYGDFFDGHDGYWYGFMSEGNSSGNATVYWVKISKTDYAMTEGQWSLSKTYLDRIGDRDETGSYPDKSTFCVMRNGYLYVRAYNKKGIYKINANNSADVTLISLGFTTAWKSMSDSGELYMILVNGLIMGWDFLIGPDDKLVKLSGQIRFAGGCSPVFQYKNFMVLYGGAYSNAYRIIYLVTPYLASINNLSSPVVKTTEKTMKITYTLTQEDSAG